jgi:hypothetical protein
MSKARFAGREFRTLSIQAHSGRANHIIGAGDGSPDSVACHAHHCTPIWNSPGHHSHFGRVSHSVTEVVLPLAL